MQSIFRWVRAVINQWGALMTGGIFMAVFSAYQWWRGEALNWPVYQWVIIGCLVVAFYLAWKEKDDALTNARKELEARKPLLVGEALQIMFGIQPNAPDAIMATLLLKIRNRGEPSIAENFRAYAMLHDEQKIVLDLQWINDWKMYGMPPQSPSGAEGSDKPPMTLTSEDAIYNKTLKPIQNGEAVVGYLPMLIRGIAKSDMSKIVVEFGDNNGTRYSCDVIWMGDKVPLEERRRIPGAK